MILLTFDTQDERDKFILLYTKYRNIVLYTIGLFIEDTYTREDILQEIYIIIANHLDNIDDKNEIRTRNYIITIARNYSKSYLRKKNRIKEEDIDKIDQYESLQKNDILLNITILDAYQRLIKEIDLLDDKYKMVLELKYINEFNDEEISSILGITKKNVQMRLYRAKNMLRDKLRFNNE